MTQERTTPGRQPHDEARMHRVSPAEGPGSPDGLALPGRAVAVRGEDPGYAPKEREGEEADRGPYEAGAEVRPPAARPARGPAEAMAEGRAGHLERPTTMGRAEEERR